MGLREDADRIIAGSIHRVLPDEAVKRALEGKSFGGGSLFVVAAGKAAWQMARAAYDVLGESVKAGCGMMIKRRLCYEQKNLQ